ncbi:MAG: hypothetical protein JWO76_7, partial [Nocardioides sp.]|nr:hypothetical protein [Nocardioides sp.]
MGHPGFNRHRSRHDGGEYEQQWDQHRGGPGG